MKKLSLQKERDYLAGLDRVSVSSEGLEDKFKEKIKDINVSIDFWINTLNKIKTLINKEEPYKADKILKGFVKDLSEQDLAARFYGK